jgi:Spy/CpxP family protein refolding chaperone
MKLRLLFVLALAAGLALAQRNTGNVNPRTGMPRNNDTFGQDRNTRNTNPRRDSPSVKSRLDTISDQLKLDKDQKKQLKEFFDDAAKDAAPIREQLRQSRIELVKAIKAGQGDAEVEKIAAKQAPLMAQMLSVETKAFGKVVGILKDNQKGRADPVFADRISGIFQSKKWTEPD